MSNAILLLLETVLIFTTVFCLSKYFGKAGLYAWVPIASIMANILTVNTINVCGLDTACGTAWFASTFLATDILSELYGKKYAKKGVLLGMVGTLVLIAGTQYALGYVSCDYAQDIKELFTGVFSLSARISISSVVMYFIANLFDVYLYDKLKNKMGGKHMWLRNNVSTIISNCIENFFFMYLAFGNIGFLPGVYDTKTVLIMAASTSVFEILIALLDTPFLYLAKKYHNKDVVSVQSEN